MYCKICDRLLGYKDKDLATLIFTLWHCQTGCNVHYLHLENLNKGFIVFLDDGGNFSLYIYLYISISLYIYFICKNTKITHIP